MPTTPIRVLLVDDHDLVRQGLKTMLASEQGVEVVGEAADGRQAMTQVEETLPDVVLMDVIMPGQDGIEATRAIKAAWPSVGVIILTGHDEQRFILDALKAGASGYVLKTADIDEVLEAVRTVARGAAMMEPEVASRVLSEFDSYGAAQMGEVFQPLTKREKEILNLMSEGLPNKAIARRLSVSERTVTTHIANTYVKLQVNNRVSAIQEGMRRRILDYKP